MVVLSSSWFRRDASVAPSHAAKVSIKDAVQALTPKNVDAEERNRFSQLLLEHGEGHLQDWAVFASSQSIPGSSPTYATPKSRQQTQWAQASSMSPRKGSAGRFLLNSKRPSIHIYENEFAPSVNMKKIEGRLHLCSRSIVFEPTDPTRGIVRCPFRRMGTPPRSYTLDKDEYKDLSNTMPLAIAFPCSRHLVIKANNLIGPFESVEVPVQLRFTFLHSSPDRFLELCQELYRLVNHNARRGFDTPELDRIMKPMLDRPFDPSNLVDIRERPLTANLRCMLVSPLQSRPGCVIVTSDRLYFQPAEGVLSDVTTAKCLSWYLADIVAYARRYKGLKDSALELYWKDGSSVFLAFERPRERERVVRLIPKHVPSHTDRDFIVEAVREWQQGSISNYDYLMLLNSAAGRSFHDLSRYPVFPWVIADYESETLDLTKEETFRDLSKPVGALNDERLQYFRDRLQGMHGMEEPFLFGTHYSAPGYVLYYLVRSMPEHMLCLQNGKFDAPDRLFYSIAHCYSCALSNHADVKELIPEFYNPSGGFDFLINARGLQLGATQTGDRVNDVKLPPWARSPRDFLRKNRKALESEMCSRILPRWIDLIFGVNSRGEAALEASNLFHPMAYLNAKTLEAMETDQERFQAELQAVEFGIVPDQLFTEAHPDSGVPAESDDFVIKDLGRAIIDGEMDGSVDADGESTRSGEQAWELLDNPSTNSVDESRNIDRIGSSESVLSRRSPNVGFGSSEMVSSAMEKLLYEKQNSGPVRKNVAPTSGEKAKLSWVSSASFSSPGSQADVMPSPPSDSATSQGQVNAGTNTGQAHQSMQGLLEDRSRYLGSSSTDSEKQSTGTSKSQPLRSAEESARFATPSAAPASFEGASQQRRRTSDTAAADVPRSLPNASTSGGSLATWDMTVLERKHIHTDSLSGCSLLLEVGGHNESFLTTVSLDGGLGVYSLSLDEDRDKTIGDSQKRGFTGTFSRLPYMGMAQTPASQSKFTRYRSHSASDPLACLALATDGHGGYVAFAGGHDDVVLAYGINSACAVASVYSHRDAVTGIDVISRSPGMAENAIWRDKSTHLMISGSWDATVKVWSVAVSSGETVSINREPLAELFDADSPVVSLSAVAVADTGIAISAGCTDGSFVVWIFHDDGMKVMIHKEPARRGAGPCSAVRWAKESGAAYLFAGFANGRIASFGLVDGALQKIGAVSVGVATKCLVYSEGILLAGCSDGGLRLIPIRDGANFDGGRPTLFPALHGKSASGVSCVSMSFTRDRCICSTGADDGSVAVFELKRAM